MYMFPYVLQSAPVGKDLYCIYYKARKAVALTKIFQNCPKTICQKPLKSRKAVFTRHTKSIEYLIGHYAHICDEGFFLLFYLPQSLLDAYKYKCTQHRHSKNMAPY